MTTTFNGDLSNVISDVTFDVYLDGEIVSQDASVFYYDGFVYCNYDNDDYSELASGEYEIRLKYEGEEICSSSVTIDKPVTYPSRSDSDLIRVGIVNNDPNESGYRTANDMDLKQMFTEENGYEASFYYSMRNDEQITGAENFIYEGVDYLLISPADTSGWDTVVADAYNAGIKVIFFDRLADADPSYYLTYVHPDTYLAALEAVDWLSDQRLSEYNIVHLQGVLGSSAQMDRTAPLDEMVAAYGNWNYVTQQTAEWDTYLAEDIVENVIASGEDFNVIYAENDTMAQGAVAALDAAGISHGLGGDVIVVSFDCYEWALEEVLAGSWNYDQQCNPFQASYIDAVIKDMEAGILPPSEVIVDDMGFDAATITASDVDDYGI
ncbi:MAG: substrate-binding domain-containing protein [Clostridiales bacterium]|nr:substrate-binding domain-containing protein [Clostridiales bacterium]